jgi:hypothetical protein
MTKWKTWRVFFEKDLFEKRKNSSKRLGKHQSDGRSQDSSQGSRTFAVLDPWDQVWNHPWNPI